MSTVDQQPIVARPRIAKLVLVSILAGAFLLRCLIAFRFENIFHGYEMFQELEQGHRLAFGSGIVPFEFVYGYRSWLLPAIIAAVMKLCAVFTSAPEFYLATLRLLAIAASMAPIACGYLIASQRATPGWGCLTALICAIWFQAVYFAPFLMPEVIAAYLTLVAVYLSGFAPSPEGRGRAVAIGLLLGLAFCLRFQMAPALLLIACWYGQTAWRQRWLPMVTSALAMVIPILGLLDAFALGSPFKSVWFNFQQNIDMGVAADFGSTSPLFYFYVLSPSLHFFVIALLVGWLAVLGALRSPLLAFSALAIVIPHTFIGHKEYRFISYALMVMPILIGLGIATLGQLVMARIGRRTMLAFTVASVTVAAFTSFYEFRAMATYRYTKNAGTLESFLAVRAYKNLCGLGVTDFPWHGTGGYTYLHRDVPVYFSYWLTQTPVAGLYGTFDHRETALATRFDLKGRPLDQYPGNTLFQHTPAFNFLIAREGRVVPGYRQMRCFSSGADRRLLPACIFERPGTCS